METHEELIKYYEGKLQKHKGGSLAVDWNCEEAQEMLFFALIDGLDEDHLRSGKAKILDVGCGLGALYGFLLKNGFQVDYTGIDIAPGMIEKCHELYPEAHFEVRDLLQNPFAPKSFDYVFLSGSVSLKLKNHERYVRRMITRMYSFASRALSFNLLSGRALAESRVFQLDGLRYYPGPVAILDFCHALTPLVNVRHEAASWTFTMQLFRRQDVTPRIINRYVAYLEQEADSAADNAIANTLMEVGAVRRVLERRPLDENSAAYWNFKAVCLARLNDDAGQLKALEKALALEPDHVWANLNMGTIAHRQGNLAEAERCYRHTLELAPDNGIARSQLLYILARRGEYAAAQKLADGYEEEAERLYFNGEVAYLSQNYGAAATYYREALKEAAYLAEAWRKLALCAAALGRSEEQVFCYEQLYQMLPYDHEALAFLSNYYYGHEQYDRVIKLLDNVVLDKELCNLRARSLYYSGQVTAAREAFEENITDSASLSSLMNLSELELEAGDYAAAARWLLLATEHPEAAAEVYAARIMNLSAKLKMAAGGSHCV